MGAIVSCDDVMCDDMFSSDEDDDYTASYRQPTMRRTRRTQQKLGEIRARMESYKQHYDTGGSLPGGIEYRLCPYTMSKDPIVQATIVPWLLEYKVAELFKRTMDKMTSTAIRRNEGVYTTCHTMLCNLSGIAYFSKIFAEKIVELHYIERFVQMLSDPGFTENQHEENSNIKLTSRFLLPDINQSVMVKNLDATHLGFSPFQTGLYQRTINILDMVLGGISNTVRHIPGHLIYKESKLAEALKPYLASNNMNIRATAMMAYSRVIGEDESKQLDGSGCIPFMIMGIKKAVNSDDRCFHVDTTAFNITSLLECVTRLAANDANKIKLVDTGLLPILVKSLKTGPAKELEISAKLIWTLCFDEDTKKKVVNQPGLITELERLSTSSHKGVQKAAKGALWKISGEDKYRKQAQQQTYENKHIFISYQWDDQQMILQLNKRLKDDGYQTWIDVEQMGGSTLDAMAAAVENAALVLICASEKYKLSPNCHTEGVYTYQRGKPVIPLMMQRRYKPDGWLGMLMGVKLYINFDGKHEFDKAYQMLMKEMKPLLKVKPDGDGTKGAASVSSTASPALQTASQKQPPSQPINAPVATWNNKQVVEWATKHKLAECSSEFDSFLKGMDGTHLENFCEMKTEASDVFYKLMTEEYKLNMKAIISLKIAMKELE